MIMKYQVHVGDKYNHWTVLEVKTGNYCVCQCDCEKKTIRIIGADALVKGKRKSCGCARAVVKPNEGDKYGHWTVIKVLDNYTCLCQCDCKDKTIKKVQVYSLLNGTSTCCGCVRKKKVHGKPRKKEYLLNVGDRFGKLTIVELDAIQDKKSKYLHKCKCECGRFRYVAPWDLVKGNIYACSRCSPRSSVHHEAHTRFHRIWSNMKSRCLNEKLDCYKDYGDRGIKVCDRWYSYLNFKEDMYESYIDHVDKYGEQNTTLDRIDVNGNYEFSNCRWATRKEQANNTRNTKYLTDTDGTVKPLYVWADIKGLNPNTVRNRIYSLGWTDKDALNKEVQYHAH